MDNKTIDNNLISIAWLLLLLLPVGNLFYIAIPILFICLYKSGYKEINSIKITSILLIAVIALSLLLNISEIYITEKDIQRDLTLIIILYTFTNLRGSSILKPYIWFAIIYVLFSQISFVFSMPSIASFYDSIYNISGYYFNSLSQDLNRIEADTIGSTMRLGGIFYNCNNCAAFVSLIYGLGMSEYKQFSKIELILFAIVCFISMFYTGSRTSLIVFSVISFIFLYTKKINIILPFIIPTVIFSILSYADVSEIRMFKIEDGMNDSFGVKINIFEYYLYRCDDVIDLLFGAGSTNILIQNYDLTFSGTDFDLGDIVISYGFLFYVVYIPFYIVIFRKIKKEYLVMTPVILWMFSNTIICNYRMSAVWLLTLGILLRKSLDSANNEGDIKE